MLERLHPRPTPAGELSAADAWTLVRRVRERVARDAAFTGPVGARLDDCGELVETEPDQGSITLQPDAAAGWSHARSRVDPEAAKLLDLYLPLCVGPRAQTLVLGHLAQSLDGRVALSGGASQFISGREDLVHTHRLRALFDAVIVGARTVEQDDPRLTTRLADGPNPTRVILDPSGRLPAGRSVFSDDAAPTVVVVGQGVRSEVTGCERVEIAAVDGWMPLPDVVAALAERGLRRLFVEGGGITVSKFLQAEQLDRLHVTVAPVLLGSGRPAIALPKIETLDQAMRLQCRHVPLGRDLLFDCPLRK